MIAGGVFELEGFRVQGFGVSGVWGFWDLGV